MITVVIAVWDEYVRFLEEAVQSAWAAGADRVIVVDNASSEAISDDPAGYELLRAPERLSAGAARNLGAAGVSEGWICLLDADDTLSPGSLAQLRAESRADVVAICGQSVIWRDGAEAERSPWSARGTRALASFPAFFGLLCTLRCQWPPQGPALLRAASFHAVGGLPDLDWGEDSVLAARLAQAGPIQISRTVVRRYRDHELSLSSAACDPRPRREAVYRQLRADRRSWLVRGAWPLVRAQHRRKANQAGCRR